MHWYDKFRRDIFWGLCGVMLYVLVANWLHWGYDSTDGAHRSGMKPHTDALTGCQYLSVPGGGITPRLGRDGNQICKS